MNDSLSFVVITMAIDDHANSLDVPTVKNFDNGSEMLEYWQNQLDTLSKDYDIVDTKMIGNTTAVKCRKIANPSHYVILTYTSAKN